MTTDTTKIPAEVSYIPRQAISVLYRGPTNTRGARLVAKCEARPRGLSVAWDHGKSRDGNYEAAARALIVAMGWDDFDNGRWVGGGSADGGAVFVWSEGPR